MDGVTTDILPGGRETVYAKGRYRVQRGSAGWYAEDVVAPSLGGSGHIGRFPTRWDAMAACDGKWRISAGHPAGRQGEGEG